MESNPFRIKQVEPPPPTPGIYPNMPFSTYLAIDAISNTRLGQMEISPLHYLHNFALDRKKYLVIGELVHAGRLEPEAFDARYVVQPEFHLDPQNQTSDGKPSDSKATSYVKGKVKQFTADNFSRQVVPREWFDEVLAIVKALHADKKANTVLNAEGPTELTIVWEDAITGLLCKARIDKAAVAVGCLADLKTTEELAKFARLLATYGYHRQLAHYVDGWHAVTGEWLEPWIIAVEKKRPFCVAAAPLHEEAIERGKQRRNLAMRRVADCLELDQWPGPPVPESWQLPAWELDAGPSLELSFEDGEVATL